MRTNTRYLLSMWGVVAVLCGLVGAGFLYNLRNGEDWIVTAAVAAMLCLLAIVIVWTRLKIRKLFTEPTPDRAIAFFRRNSARQPNAKAMAAYLCANAAVVYGDFDRARQELCAVNWSTLPPWFQCFESHIHCLFALFESKDYARALEFAQEAVELCAVPSAFPGARTSQRALSAHVAICRLLLGGAGPEALAELEKAVARFRGISAANPAWALAVHHHHAGNEDRAAKYMAIARRLVPHSPVLTAYPSPSVMFSR